MVSVLQIAHVGQHAPSLEKQTGPMAQKPSSALLKMVAAEKTLST